MMRVTMYAAARVRGGLLAHLTALAAELTQRGHQVNLLLSPDPAIDAVAAECRKAGAGVTRLEVKGKGDLGGMLALARTLREQRPEIFHVHLASPVEAIPALLVAGRIGSARLVTTEHAPTWHPLARLWSRAAKRMASRPVGAVIALCDADARYLSERFDVPASILQVIPNGVAPPEPLPGREEARGEIGLPPERAGDFVVGCVGALETKKGILDLLEAAAAQEAGLTVWLAGEGSLAPQLRERRSRESFGLLLPGHVSNVARLLPALDLFVLPSHQEAMPLALLEAMAAGLPIVATRVGGVAEALDEGRAGGLVAPFDPSALADAIRELRRDPVRRRAFAGIARERALRLYTVARMADGVEGLYRRLLAGRAEQAGPEPS